MVIAVISQMSHNCEINMARSPITFFKNSWAQEQVVGTSFTIGRWGCLTIILTPFCPYTKYLL